MNICHEDNHINYLIFIDNFYVTSTETYGNIIMAGWCAQF